MTQPKRNGSTRRHRAWAAKVLRNATVCALCGKPLDHSLKWPHPMSPSADHKVAWVRAPHLRYDPTNGQAAHLVCNQRRGDRDVDLRPTTTSREW